MTDPAMNDASQNERLDEILAAYLESERSGQRLDRQRLLAENPDLADELRAFFADHDRMKAVAEPLRVADGSKGSSVADEATLITHCDPALAADESSLPPTEADLLRAQRGKDSLARPGSIIRYFGDYELLSEIARGGMGVVYKARQVKLNRVVALKMILSGVLAGESEVQRFLAEAEAAANLDHPGIVPIFEVGEHDGQHFFSMGLIEGQSLAAKISGGPLEPREAAELLVKVAEAVQFAHDNGVIHRDLKPANVLLDQKGQPRVTDFGLAKRIRGDSNLTGSGQILGTPSYMPPEQAAGKTDRIGPVSDVYALGAILYALLTGRPPFFAASPMETLLQVLDKEPVQPRQLNPQVPLDLETICLMCLEKKPSRRYASAQQLVDELTRFLEGRPILARPVGIIEKAVKWSLRNPAIAVWLAALPLLVFSQTSYIAFLTCSAACALHLGIRPKAFHALGFVSVAAVLAVWPDYLKYQVESPLNKPREAILVVTAAYALIFGSAIVVYDASWQLASSSGRILRRLMLGALILTVIIPALNKSLVSFSKNSLPSAYVVGPLSGALGQATLAVTFTVIGLGFGILFSPLISKLASLSRLDLGIAKFSAAIGMIGITLVINTLKLWLAWGVGFKAFFLPFSGIHYLAMPAIDAAVFFPILAVGAVGGCIVGKCIFRQQTHSSRLSE